MKEYNITDVVNKLIGETEPYGSLEIDITRFNNQTELMDLCDNIVSILLNNAKFCDRLEHSIKSIGCSAREYLADLRNYLNNYFEE